jgi:myosin-crossreactive antigen
MRFSMTDRLELVALVEASEDKLGASRITDWLSPAFFETNFWFLWQTTFAFQPWHSAVELKRYLHRFMNEFPRIDTLGGVRADGLQSIRLDRPPGQHMAGASGGAFRHGHAGLRRTARR